jgi:hypothetical protein
MPGGLFPDAARAPSLVDKSFNIGDASMRGEQRMQLSKIHILLTLTVAAWFASVGEAASKPTITKLGAVGLNLVENTPIVFNDKLYRLQWENRSSTTSSDWHFDFVDVAAGTTTTAFATGWRFASAYTENGTVYVTGTNAANAANVVKMWTSTDLKTWTESTALTFTNTSSGTYTVFNTSICKAGSTYVMSYELGSPASEVGTPFTIRFAKSTDLNTWTVTSTSCVYAKDRYTSCPTLRYCDGYYYLFYVEDFRKIPSADFETYIVRSKDLVTWESSTYYPVLSKSSDDKLLYAEGTTTFTDAQKTTIANATDRSNSDMDFCEYNGKLVIYYSWGNQTGTEFLARAEYNGTEAQFLHAWFGEATPEPSCAAMMLIGGVALGLAACVRRKWK